MTYGGAYGPAPAIGEGLQEGLPPPLLRGQATGRNAWRHGLGVPMDECQHLGA